MRKLLPLFLLLSVCRAQYMGNKPMQGEQIDMSNLITRGLIGYWSAGYGGTVATDLSGGGNDGTLAGNTYLRSGKFGPAWYMDGVDDVIQCGTDSVFSLGTNPYTIVVWVNTYTFDVWGVLAFGAYDPAWVLDINGFMYIYDGGAKADGTNVAMWGQWNQLVWVRRSTGANDTHYYMNSVKDTTTVTHSESISVGTGVVIGSDRVATSEYDFAGYIDSVMIYNRALTEDEIRQLYADPYCMFRRDRPELYVAAGAPPAGNPQFIMIMRSSIPLVLILFIAGSFIFTMRRDDEK